MTSSVLPPLSSKVTVVTGPPSPPSSLVQTRRECGVTSRYLPKNSSGFEASWPNTKRYLPPTRTSISQERRNMPIDFGTHHCLNSSGLVHASNTMRAGPLKVRVTTSSRSDFRSTVVRFFIGVASLSLLASIDLLPSRDDELTLGLPFHGRAVLHRGGLTLSSCVHRPSPSVSTPRQPCPTRRSARPRAGDISRSRPSLPPVGAGRACRSARARPSPW